MKETDKSITDLIDPVDIPPFKLRVDNSEWHFPGAEVSTKVYGESGCSFSGGQVMHAMEGNMLTLSDQAALLFLAIEKIKGNDLNGVPKESIEGALRIFYNNLYLTLTTSNPGAMFQCFFGEWAYDVLDFRGATETAREGYVPVKWIKRPKVIKEAEEKYSYEVGENSEVVQTVLPQYAGVVDGYLDPRTGAPFEVDRSQKYGCTEFLKKLAKRVISCAYDTTEDKVPDEAVFLYERMLATPILSQALTEKNVSLKDLKLEDFIHLWKPSYAFSHCFEDKPLPLAETMVAMQGIDEKSTLFTVSLGIDMPNCGIQVRSAKYYSGE